MLGISAPFMRDVRCQGAPDRSSNRSARRPRTGTADGMQRLLHLLQAVCTATFAAAPALQRSALALGRATLRRPRPARGRDFGEGGAAGVADPAQEVVDGGAREAGL